MVIPAGLPNTQQLILAEKLANGRLTMKEVLYVRFSQLEGTEPGLQLARGRIRNGARPQ
jgi:protein-L-isoaspartate(D-aspartate) O-methyltransferase